MAAMAILENDNNWKIEKATKFYKNNWNDISQPNMILNINYDVLYVISSNLIVFNMKLNEYVKGYFKYKTIILAYQENEQLSKIKLQINCNITDIEKIVDKLKIYLPIHNLNTPGKQKLDDTLRLELKSLFEKELSREPNCTNKDSIFPSGFPVNEFLKACILDPSFPDMVDEVEKSINSFLE